MKAGLGTAVTNPSTEEEKEEVAWVPRVSDAFASQNVQLWPSDRT